MILFLNVYMPTAAVLLSGVCLGDSDAGHQGSSLSDHRKTTGLLPTCSPLVQKVRDHSLPKAFLEESSAWFN